VRVRARRSQSPDEDSLSSDIKNGAVEVGAIQVGGLNPLTRIHCLPTWTKKWLAVYGHEEVRLNPLTRIHCLPTENQTVPFPASSGKSQSPDEDSLSSDEG